MNGCYMAKYIRFHKVLIKIHTSWHFGTRNKKGRLIYSKNNPKLKKIKL